MTDPDALCLMWAMALTDDDEAARRLRSEAYAAGATAADVARWWGARDRRMAAQVTVVVAS